MNKPYNLEERSFLFAKQVALFNNKIPRNVNNFIFSKQLIRSASSIGANYIEANESLGKKDRSMHMKIARKEAKETIYWLKLILVTNPSINGSAEALIYEATQLKLILSKIINNLNH